jgi:hypothetical protein
MHIAVKNKGTCVISSRLKLQRDKPVLGFEVAEVFKDSYGF